MKDYILTKENEEEQNKEKNKDKYFNGDNNETETKVVDNHIYYYSSVSKKSALELNIKLREVENKLLKKYNDHNNHQEYIYLHINSFGGSVFSAFSVIDTIKNMKVPVVSIIEGAAASAATLISVMCDYRIIYKTSYMLIHQLSSGSWGKMNELEEEMEGDEEDEEAALEALEEIAYIDEDVLMEKVYKRVANRLLREKRADDVAEKLARKLASRVSKKLR
mgnify:CR=1 FL=1